MARSKSGGTEVGQVFGQVLRDLRLDSTLSQEDLGFESGYHRTYISLLERGQRTPSLKALFELAAALGIEPVDIVRQVQERLSQSRGK